MNMSESARKSADQIYREMENSIFGTEERKAALHRNAKELSKRVFDLSCAFLQNNRLMNHGTGNSMESGAGCEAFNADSSLTMIGNAALRAFCQDCGIPQDRMKDAMSAVASLLCKAQACHGSNELFRSQHFGHGRSTLAADALQNTAQKVFAPSLFGTINNIGMPSQEAFGADIDKVLPDIRASLAVTMLQFHRGLLDRIMHRRTSASPYVKYVVPYSEVYDMLLSNDKSAKVRNEGEHIVPFIDLYGNPRSVSNILQPIVPLTQNDVDGQLFADGFIKFNQRVNIFDLSKIPNELGKTHINYTDLVSENVIVDSVIVTLEKDGVVENFQVSLRNVNGARLQMTANTSDSGIRQTYFTHVVKFTKNTPTITGTASTILADCTATDCLRVAIRTAVSCNLKTADVEGLGHIYAEAYNSARGPVATAVTELVEGLTVSLAAFALDARYSEENLRKSNLAIRHHVRTFDFEISNGRNIMVDYSFQEELPEFLMSLVTEATSLGCDHRGIDIIIKELMHVYDVTNLENSDPNFHERLQKVGFEYVAGQLVRPVVYLNTIDLDNVDTIRSGDVLGDIRQYVEWELLNLVSLFYQNSFYKHQLNPGEKPVFKVFTSAVILENLFSVPHYHNHLSQDEAVDGGTVEYRRVLPNGTVLDCVTCTFNYMRDKIVMIPFRENNPDDVLNFGHNWDYGTFVAHYNPQIDNAVNKRVFSNSRSMPVPTNPSGIYLDVRNISKIVDMFALTNPGGAVLPQPAELLEAQM